jgi:hypothetical protein
MNKPTEPTAESKRSRGFARYVVGPFVIIAIYFLLPGPLAVVHRKGLLNSRTVGGALFAIYWPWRWTYEYTPLRKPLGVYMHFWDPANFEKDGRFIPGHMLQ